MPMEDSIEPSYDVVRNVIQGFGFQLEVINAVVFSTDTKDDISLYCLL